MSKSSIGHVAQMAGVSKATVSRVLSGNYQYMRSGTRERVEQAIRDLGFRPSSLARSLTSKRTMTMAVLISDIRNPFYPEVITGIEEVALKNGCGIFLCNTNCDVQRGSKSVRSLIDKGGDGVLIMSSSTSEVWLEELTQSNIPAVILD
ncbi:MAG TPA: LacI family DNA-binding transcriptional regulator [Aggregatilineaceae bacterium]|nr:LacI family DNA-binding transcriptional regulator [Aggregatilineaceae bacterium]